jgi:hypothetical protein
MGKLHLAILLGHTIAKLPWIMLLQQKVRSNIRDSEIPSRIICFG